MVATINSNILSSGGAASSGSGSGGGSSTVSGSVGITGVVTTVGNRGIPVVATITTPATLPTTGTSGAYNIGQVIASAASGLTALPFLDFGSANANTRVYIDAAELLSSNGAAATKLQAALFLFGSGAPAGVGLTDGAAFNPTDAALRDVGGCRIGFSGAGIPQLGTATYGYQASQLGLQATTDANGRLYFAIVTLNTYLRVVSERFSVSLVARY